ncbi:hypothetical protein ACH5RR_033070 [Cinchona calisaya]|uniref:C2H2-type domain-containing protein n=1 Tax=Cinchona calisaya TaxID=153742 RepID=A0ABD2YJY0_9GENT
MERSSRENNGGRNMKEINNKNGLNKVKNSSWDFASREYCNGTTDHQEADLLGLFSWPPRSYTCSFCKREFRSAQALGGHMNVHRRDRARLRQSPTRDVAQYSLLNLNLDPNPNFMSFNAYNPSPPSTKCSFIPPPVSTISTTPPATFTEMRKWGHNNNNKASGVVQDLMKSSTTKATKRLFELHGKEGSVLKKGDIVRLELEIGLVAEAKEDLDLELRLGYT